MRAGGCLQKPGDYLAQFDAKKETLPATYYVECLLGNGVKSFGLEDPTLLRESVWLNTPQAYRTLDPYQGPQREAELALERGKVISANLLAKMAEYKRRTGVMAIGYEHFEEVKETLSQQGANFVIVAVPHLEESLGQLKP